MMQIGMLILIIRNPLLGDVFFLVIHLYHERVKNKIYILIIHISCVLRHDFDYL